MPLPNLKKARDVRHPALFNFLTLERVFDTFKKFARILAMDENFLKPVRKIESFAQNKILGTEFSNWLKTINTAYRLVEYFPEAEPLALRAKEKILDISENLVLASGGGQGDRVLKDMICQDIDIFLNYLVLAKGSGWISAMNFLIISAGLREIKNSFGEAAISQDKQVKAEVLAEKLPKALSKLSARQKRIMEFLQERKRAQVADLQQVLPDVTKRTIRRDLDELLNGGQIVRMGEFNQVFYQVYR